MPEQHGTNSPRVFISYSWDSDAHCDWVESLATQLRNAGIDARLDRWRDKNQSIDDFMMVELERADFVLAICTPDFKQKVMDNAEGTQLSASGTEMGTAAAFRRVSGKVTVPVLARGEYSDAAPANLLGSEYYDFTQGDRRSAFDSLKKHLLGQTQSAPPLGQISDPEEREPLPDIFENAPSASAAASTPGGGGPSAAAAKKRSAESTPAKSPNKLAWLGVPLVLAAAGLLAANQWDYWPFGVTDDSGGGIDDPTPPPKPYWLVLEKLQLKECEGAAGPFGRNEEPCLFLNDTVIFGCKLEEFTCGTAESTINLLNGEHEVGRVQLDPEKNILALYEEDGAGECINAVTNGGSFDKCVWKGSYTIKLDEPVLENIKFHDGRGEYRLWGKVVQQ